MGLTQADSFIRDLHKLSRDDQSRVFDALLKYSLNPAMPGLQVKPMQRAEGLWEIRASRELRIIGKRDGDHFFCYGVGHHDEALRRAERVRTESDLAQEAVRTAAAAVPPLDAPTSLRIPRQGPLAAVDDVMLREKYGVPQEWIATLRAIRTQDQVLATGIEDALSSEEAFWRLIALFEEPAQESTGAHPVYRVTSEAIARAFVSGEIEDLQFNLPASSWAIVESSRQGPILVKGGPGSGKTLVALYRALHVLEEARLLGAPRVLYVTFTRQLRDDAREKVRRLRGRLPEGLVIETFDAIAERLAPGRKTVFDRDVLEQHLRTAMNGNSMDAEFVRDEIVECIEWRNVRTAEEYAVLSRRGRGSRLTAGQRAALWSVYEAYRERVHQARLRDVGTMRMDAADRAAQVTDAERYDFVIVDEIQDLPWSTLAMIAALARGQGQKKHLMLVGDSGQSIYQSGFRWSELGLRMGGGNVFTLGRSERNTREILAFARALPGDAIALADGGDDCSKSGQIPRVISGFRSAEHRREWIAADVAARLKAGVCPADVAIVAHGKSELRALAGELSDRGIATVEYQQPGFYRERAVKLITAHSAKGLEFSEVYVPDANAGTYPFYKNASLPVDEREERDAQDCKLLYVACTRAGDRLTVLYDRESSPFLEGALRYAQPVEASLA